MPLTPQMELNKTQQEKEETISLGVTVYMKIMTTKRRLDDDNFTAREILRYALMKYEYLLQVVTEL